MRKGMLALGAAALLAPAAVAGSTPGVSTTTIVRVGRFLRQEPFQGYRRVIDTLESANVG